MPADKLHERESSPEANAFLSLLNLIIFLTFIIFGAVMGYMMTRLLGADSGLALLYGVLAFPVSYVISFVLSMNVLPLDGLWRLLPRQHYELDDSSSSPTKMAFRRRALIAIPVSVVIALGAGIAVGGFAETAGWIVAMLFALVGLAYGALFYIFAQFDILPMTR